MNKTYSFNKVEYTEKSLFALPDKELVKLHNEMAKKAGKAETKRFSSIGAGLERTMKLLKEVGTPVEAAPAKSVASAPAASLGTAKVKKAPKAKKAKAEGEARRGTNLAAPGHAPLACREGSKQCVLVDQLRGNGATMAELIEALSGGNKPWVEATVRSGFGWDLKQKGYGVVSKFDADGTERFKLVVPEGHKIPAHTPLKGTPKVNPRQTKLPV